MCDFSRVFLPENHPYRREAYAFNGKPERTQMLKIMTANDWLRAYDTEKEKEIAEMFDSNGEPMFDDPEFFETHDEKMIEGMNKKLIFYELPYWDNLNISHLPYPMHIFKNVLRSLWHHISSKRSDKLKVKRDIISSNTKRNHC